MAGSLRNDYIRDIEARFETSFIAERIGGRRTEGPGELSFRNLTEYNRRAQE